MKSYCQSPFIRVGEKRFITRTEFQSLIKTYNCYLNNSPNLQLNLHEEKGHIVVEGALNVFWGVRQHIRLKAQDEKQTLAIQLHEPVSPVASIRGMTRWGEFDDLHQIAEIEESNEENDQEVPKTKGPPIYECATLKQTRVQQPIPESPGLYRTMSDASLVKKRVKTNTLAERQKTQQHRVSINGHFYNYETSIFIPTFGCVTNVRVNSNMTTHEVIALLLQKYKVENDPIEFALYCIHASGERRKIKKFDYPLWERLLNGPSGTINKMYLMDTDEQEISTDVAQYLRFDFPFLEEFLQKLKEEETKEIQKVYNKYTQQKEVIRKYLHLKIISKTETTV
ncbi:ras association domain-containing protein 6 [Erpetoichthys calabaricus]|uniref:Ras association domain family member 6 n=1 Tax=Erpetoichthys calabaricus TaxID=27687 RepID=A0A8C4XBK2_ERPCA|nr:ras association domain-containing protein 6 [Erpetoichthys calabaricus]XP_051784276.1 ras association domain-containing protein 6 [Erpetoichthys calabaricus]XP_051784277.1 ras association domain-containing protein 6 [Erpetoichthys calabaricus]